MRNLVYFLAAIASLMLSVIQLMMFARAILSWFPMDEDSRLQRFLYAATEPFIFPVRVLLERIPFFASSPIDLSFMITFLLLSIVQSML